MTDSTTKSKNWNYLVMFLVHATFSAVQTLRRLGKWGENFDKYYVYSALINLTSTQDFGTYGIEEQ